MCFVAVEREINMEQEIQELSERVVTINRVTKVVKGGRNFSFSALVVTGDGKGRVGIGKGKAGEVPESINKASRSAKKALAFYNLREGRTIAHQVTGVFGAAKVILKPAGPGTGLIAGGPVRSVLECVGVKDILSKRVGSRNPHNLVKATLNGLSQLQPSRQRKPFPKRSDTKASDTKESGFKASGKDRIKQKAGEKPEGRTSASEEGFSKEKEQKNIESKEQ